MSPRVIVDSAIYAGLDFIAITDHNSSAMADAVAEAARQRSLGFLYGIEIQTAEEVHVLGYFDDPESLHGFAEEIYPLLPDKACDPAAFGDQVIVDVDDEILGYEPKLLVNSLGLSFERAVDCIRLHGGLAVPAHVDRAPFGVLAQLGYPPAGWFFPMIEVSGAVMPKGFGSAKRLCTSDAHEPSRIGHRSTRFVLEGISVEELELAAMGVDGRSMVCEGGERRSK
jgi:hypothetical protein